MPIFTAAGRRVAIASASASRTAAGARGSTRWMPSPCSVHAVPTACARAPRAAAVATSRSSPAPPEGSMPPMTTTTTDAFVCGGFTRPYHIMRRRGRPQALPLKSFGRGDTTPGADSVRQVHAVRAHRTRRYGGGVQGTHPGPGRLRTRVRRQADSPAPLRRHVVHQDVRRGGEAVGAPQPPQHRPHLRAGRGRGRVLHLDGVHPRPRPVGDDARDLEGAGPAAARAGRVHRPRGLPRARLRAQPHRRERPPAGHDPPRRVAVERDAVVRGRGEDARLRHRQGAGRRRRADEERHA